MTGYNIVANLAIKGFTIDNVALQAAKSRISSALSMPITVGVQPATFKGLNTLNTSLSQVQAHAAATTKIFKNMGLMVSDANYSLREFGSTAAISARRFLAFNIAATAIFGVVRAIQSGITEAIDFESKMIKVGQVASKSVTNLRGLTDEITRLATGLGVSSKELADVSVVLAQAGLSARDTRIALEALALTDVAPNFENLTDTTDGAIAMMSQFRVQAKDLKSELSSLNAVAGAYAVESADIISAIKRAGGAFRTAGGDLKQLEALFTSVRATTRESADTIGTGFRTIFARVQRPRTIQMLKEVGVSLQDLEGNFIGPWKAVEKLNIAMGQLDQRSQRYAQIVEELGGIRQISKVVPVIQQFSTALRAYEVALEGTNSLEEQAQLALTGLGRKVAQVREEFLATFRDLTGSDAIRGTITDILSLASSLVKLTKALEPVLPLIKALALTKGFAAAIQFSRGFGSQFTKVPSIMQKADGGRIHGTGSTDSVPAMLTPGEFVVNKHSASKLGLPFLQRINKFAKGGPVGFALGGNVPYYDKRRNGWIDPNTGKVISRVDAEQRLTSVAGKKTESPIILQSRSSPMVSSLYREGIDATYDKPKSSLVSPTKPPEAELANKNIAIAGMSRKQPPGLFIPEQYRQPTKPVATPPIAWRESETIPSPLLNLGTMGQSRVPNLEGLTRKSLSAVSAVTSRLEELAGTSQQTARSVKIITDETEELNRATQSAAKGGVVLSAPVRPSGQLILPGQQPTNPSSLILPGQPPANPPSLILPQDQSIQPRSRDVMGRGFVLVDTPTTRAVPVGKPTGGIKNLGDAVAEFQAGQFYTTKAEQEALKAYRGERARGFMGRGFSAAQSLGFARQETDEYLARRRRAFTQEQEFQKTFGGTSFGTSKIVTSTYGDVSQSLSPQATRRIPFGIDRLFSRSTSTNPLTEQQITARFNQTQGANARSAMFSGAGTNGLFLLAAFTPVITDNIKAMGGLSAQTKKTIDEFGGLVGQIAALQLIVNMTVGSMGSMLKEVYAGKAAFAAQNLASAQAAFANTQEAVASGQATQADLAEAQASVQAAQAGYGRATGRFQIASNAISGIMLGGAIGTGIYAWQAGRSAETQRQAMASAGNLSIGLDAARRQQLDANTQSARAWGALGGGWGGALTGAAIGTMIAPGVGTFAGGVIGGLAGTAGGFGLGGRFGSQDVSNVNNARLQALVENSITNLTDSLRDIDQGFSTVASEAGRVGGNLGEAFKALDQSVGDTRTEIFQQLKGQVPQIREFIGKIAQSSTSLEDFESRFGGAGGRLVEMMARLSNRSITELESSIKTEIETRNSATAAQNLYTAALSGMQRQLRFMTNIEGSLLSVSIAANKAFEALGYIGDITSGDYKVSPATGLTGLEELLARPELITNQGQFGSMMGRAFSSFGPAGTEISGQLTSTAGVLNSLPDILIRSAMRSGGTTGDEFAVAFRTELERAGVGRNIANMLESTVGNMIGEGEKGPGKILDALAKNPQEVVEDIVSKSGLKEQFEQAGNIVQQLNQQLANVSTQYTRALQRQININNVVARTLEIRADKEVALANLLERPEAVFPSQMRGLESRQQFFGGDIGNNAQALGDKLIELRNKLQALDAQIDGNIETNSDAYDQQRALNEEYSKVETALKGLASGAKVGVIQTEVDRLRQNRRTRTDLVADFVFGDRGQRGAMSNALAATNIAMRRGNLQGIPDRMRPDVRGMLERLYNIPVSDFGANAKDFGIREKGTFGDVYKKILRNEFKQLRGVDDKTLDMYLNPNGEEQARQQELIGAYNEMIAANNSLAKVLQTERDAFIKAFTSQVDRIINDSQKGVLQGEVTKLKQEEVSTRAQATQIGTLLSDTLPRVRGTFGISTDLSDRELQQRLENIVASEGDIRSIGRLTKSRGQLNELQGLTTQAAILPTKLNYQVEQSLYQNPQIKPLYDLYKNQSGANFVSFLQSRGFSAQDVTSLTTQPNIDLLAEQGSFKDFSTAFTKIIQERINTTATSINAAREIPDKLLPQATLDRFIADPDALGKALNQARDALTQLGQVDLATPLTQQNIQLQNALTDLAKNIKIKSDEILTIGAPTGGVVTKAMGGPIFSPRGTDTVPAMLTPGEFVVNAAAAQRNLPLLEEINAQGFARGGRVQRREAYFARRRATLEGNLGAISARIDKTQNTDARLRLIQRMQRLEFRINDLNTRQGVGAEILAPAPIITKRERKESGIYVQGRKYIRGEFKMRRDLDKFATSEGLPTLDDLGVTVGVYTNKDIAERLDSVGREPMGTYYPGSRRIALGNTRPTTLLHEYGHALDYSQGTRFSARPDVANFIKANYTAIMKSVEDYSKKNGYDFKTVKQRVANNNEELFALITEGIAGNGIRSQMLDLVAPGRRGFALGGFVSGLGTRDTVPAMLTPGEYVLNRAATQQIGVSKLDRVNRMAQGGVVPNNINIDYGALQSFGQSFNTSLNVFGNAVNQLSNAMSLFPSEITLQGKHTVEVLLNDGGILQQLEPMVADLIVEKVGAALNNLVSQMASGRKPQNLSVGEALRG